jgi:hypothetical protein
MKDPNNQMKRLVDDIVKTKEILNGFYGIEPARPVPGAPAPSKELDALEKTLRRRGLPFPPSYRAFLAAHNGIEGFNAALNLVSAKAVTEPVDKALESDFPTLSKFVIARGNTPEFISLDPETAKGDGEMEVVWVMGDGGQFRYPNFGTFLRSLHDELQKTLAQEEADRKNLGD